MFVVGSGLEEYVVQVYGYAAGKLPNNFPRAIMEAFDMNTGDDAVAIVSVET